MATEGKINTTELGEKIVKVIKTIYDPEIPVDIYELGLIYDVFVNEDYAVKVLMTLTTPNCPVAETLPLAGRAVFRDRSPNPSVQFPWRDH